MRRTLLIVAALVMGSAFSAFAHHSFAAEYDADMPLTLHGTIVKVEWVNPHSMLWMDVRTPARGVVQWGLELPPPNILLRRGVQRTTLWPGQPLTAMVFPARDGRSVASAHTLILRDGRRIVTGVAAPPY